MIIGGKEAKDITVTGSDGEVLVVITDTHIIEYTGVSVVIDWD